MILNKFLRLAIEAAEEAGSNILDIYEKDDFFIKEKSNNSPLTLADEKSNSIIIEILKHTFPILSEEGKEINYEKRKHWEYFWLIDPLDGTKEFISRNGEFTVNIALIYKTTPIIGVVYAPVLKKMYWATNDSHAFRKDDSGEIEKLQISNCTHNSKEITVVCSRSHINKETNDYISRFSSPNLINMGSSLKFMLVAEGRAQVYPRFAPTMEWDTGAAHIILKQAGGQIINAETHQDLLYNKPSLVNPPFIAHNGLIF